MKAGTFVEVTAGEHIGAQGVVLTTTVDGIAVRLQGSNAWPFPTTVVMNRSEIRRRPRPRRELPVGVEALL